MNIRLFYEVNKSKIKIGIAILISVIILTIIICRIAFNPENDIPFYKRPTITTISSSDNNFNISYNNSYNITSKKTNIYVLALENEEDFLLTTTKTPKILDFEFNKLLSSDKETFLANLENYKETTAISNKTYNNISGAEYNIIYTYKSIDYVLTEFLTEINGNLYFFDIRYPKALKDKYEPIMIELLNSITIK